MCQRRPPTTTTTKLLAWSCGAKSLRPAAVHLGCPHHPLVAPSQMYVGTSSTQQREDDRCHHNKGILNSTVFCTFAGSCCRWSLNFRPRGKQQKTAKREFCSDPVYTNPVRTFRLKVINLKKIFFAIAKISVTLGPGSRIYLFAEVP